MPRKKATADELEARAEANGYQFGAHREEARSKERPGNSRTELQRQEPQMRCWSIRLLSISMNFMY
jgi:hypothetical protein